MIEYRLGFPVDPNEKHSVPEGDPTIIDPKLLQSLRKNGLLSDEAIDNFSRTFPESTVADTADELRSITPNTVDHSQNQ